MPKLYKDDVSIVLCGEAGAGIQTVENVVSRIFKNSGFNLFTSKEYMSRVRGGSNSTQLRISSAPKGCYCDRMDIFVPLDKEAYEHCFHRITDNTVILADKEKVGDIGKPYIDVPLEKYAKEIGSPIFANIIASGMILGLFKADFANLEDIIRKSFAKKGEDTINSNIQAGRKGYEIAEMILKDVQIDVSKDPDSDNKIILSGAEALFMGALAGGCDFIASYPMTPGTNFFTFLAKYQKEFGVIVEQAEDEIAAINMAIGAGYAGARSVVSTSGGGFALMTEGISLSAMTETPVVVHLAQRPGPATGLPTRTEQGDLELVMHAGHGEFSKAVYAPGNPKQCFDTMRTAFDTADKYQIPVFVLSDQYLNDSIFNCPVFDVPEPPVKHIFEMPADYMRYRVTENGVSPRGVPGNGKGFICADSDEHDETGRITESEGIRVLMNDKRIKKYGELAKESLEPELFGKENYETLIVCWGSNYDVVKEALGMIGDDSIAMLHFTQLYPLHLKTFEILKKAKKIFFVEGNATGQFENLVRKYTGIHADGNIHKYDGFPFSADKLAQQIKGLKEGK